MNQEEVVIKMIRELDKNPGAMEETLHGVVDTLQKTLDEMLGKKVDESKLRYRLTNAIRQLKRLEGEAHSLGIRHQTNKKVVRMYDLFIANFGFRKVGAGYNGQYTQAKLKYCRCGHQAEVQASIYDLGKWLVMCPRCNLRTEDFQKIKDAMEAWQHDQWTETSVMLQTPLKEKGFYDLGTPSPKETGLSLA